jgi:hypothetical protein
MAKVPPQRIDHPSFANGQPPAPPPLAPALPCGVMVGRFVLIRVLHESAQGFVYLAHDAQGRDWVLKEYCPRALALRMEDGSVRARQAGEAISISVAREAYRDEADALARLAAPGLVRVTETLVAFHTLFRVMPRVAGESLAQWVGSREGPPSVRELRALVQGLLEPLAAVHAAGLLHGCVAPEQMLVSGARSEPTVVLLGFGNVARELGSAPEEPWAAPEVVRGDRQARVTTAADLYSVAACAWYAATGELPPAASRRAEGLFWSVREGLDALVDEAGDAPSLRAGLVQALDSALAMAPEARPQRVADMQRLLAGDAQVRLISSQPAPLWVGEAPDRDVQRLSAQVLAAMPPLPDAVATQIETTAPAEAAPRPRQVAPARAPAPQPDTAPATRRGRWPAGVALLALAGLAVGVWWWASAGVLQPREAGATPSPVLAPQGPVDATPSATIPAAAPAGASTPAVSSGLANSPSAEGPSVTSIPNALAAADAAPGAVASRAAASASPALQTSAASRGSAKARGVAARLCAGKTQFAEVYCLQQQCSKPALRSHPQCVAARRVGDVP